MDSVKQIKEAKKELEDKLNQYVTEEITKFSEKTGIPFRNINCFGDKAVNSDNEYVYWVKVGLELMD